MGGENESVWSAIAAVGVPASLEQLCDRGKMIINNDVDNIRIMDNRQFLIRWYIRTYKLSPPGTNLTCCFTIGLDEF
jgi:hypothetical protein